MKILYLTPGDHVDYQNDCLLIGLKELYGAEVVDFNKQAHNYDTFDPSLIKKFWGQGMTVTRVLSDLDVDRTDITTKIKHKFFDYIVYGSIWRCSNYIEKVLEYYPKEKVIVVDGEDHTNIHQSFNLGIPYFKRELIFEKDRLFPISFAIPTTKVYFNKIKTKNYSFITPLDPKTYVYNDESSYYKDYQQARFAVTLKKAGWDCMRHYEIMANGCIPYFVNIETCPLNTLKFFPKQLCSDVIRDLNTNDLQVVYEKFADKFLKHLLENNTTKALGKYFTKTIQYDIH